MERNILKKNYLVKSFLLIIGFIFLPPFPSYSGFLIQLNNGGEIYTENYQFGEKHIYLYLKDGILKVPKEDVKYIRSEKKRNADENAPEAKKEIEKVKKEEILKENEKNFKFKKAEIDLYKKRKAELIFKLDQLQILYMEEKNKVEREKIREKMVAITKEYYNLQNEVSKKNNGVLPEWWQQD